METLSNVIGWIESHGTTVGLFQWAIVILAAWLLGAFRFLRAILKRPSVEIEPLSSRCVLRNIGKVDEAEDNVQAILLLEVGINNPTADVISVREFTLSVEPIARLRSKHLLKLHPTTIPCRVSQTVGGYTKLLKNWFSNYSDGRSELTISGKIEPREYVSGFLLFIYVGWGSFAPYVKNEKVSVTISARLTTGEKISARSNVIVYRNPLDMEGMVPGILDHAMQRSTWTITRDEKH